MVNCIINYEVLVLENVHREEIVFFFLEVGEATFSSCLFSCPENTTTLEFLLLTGVRETTVSQGCFAALTLYTSNCYRHPDLPSHKLKNNASFPFVSVHMCVCTHIHAFTHSFSHPTAF